ncbi:exonuclease II Exo2 [Malassezia psittaci]|uniref:5'-3' exoribonuclease 1 n=1 Tax=Malassezia psittaci TaxID=1821823 RepID=A0AAF0FDF7_9BASI|nr:exonuclease II Exo2 [Malassezia psittaci]
MQMVEDNRIPEFDNLYLDMNGIIHNCSHPRDDEVAYHFDESDIFLGIFAYIEHLFARIRPQKVFFLAVDGVAPRAKMNQQRSRRFRTAQEAKENLEKAQRRGEDIADKTPFDSNCITPGTIFMQKLSLQLEYFIAKKVSEDSNWRNVQVILSGHDAVGEGEHKIMEFIRTLKAQPDYNPNTRHCLYGLDADLIMLGLLSHDPHFALLREEVVFGPQRTKKSSPSLETRTFYLLHISLLREYLELEFDSLRKTLPFEFDLERIIDDYILLHLFVGNDFLPHLPGLHINEGAIETLFRIYEKILPKAGGYLNDHGTLRPERLQLVINELFELERNCFLRDHPDLTRDRRNASSNKRNAKQHNKQANKPMVITPEQRDWVTQLHQFVVAFNAHPEQAPTETLLADAKTDSDRKFLQGLADALNLHLAWKEYDPINDTTATKLSLPHSKVQQFRMDHATDEAFPEEHALAVQRALAPYMEACVDSHPQSTDLENQPENAVGENISQDADQVSEAEKERKIKDAMHKYRVDYYRTKLNMDYNQESIRALAFNYIEGMQWVLHYYYEGNSSWGWFYHYHYAPQISDLAQIDQFEFAFQKGRPFLPFEQLMGVLPPLSKALIPPAFQDLMTDVDSPILDFYPSEFEADLNGKKNSWEAVVKIPFIQEDRLLKAIQLRENKLTKDERIRNQHGPPKQFQYDHQIDVTYPSSLPGFFPDLPNNHVRVEPLVLPSMEGREYVKTLSAGVQLGIDAMPGFPTLKTLSFTHQLRKAGVNVHGQASSSNTMVLTINPSESMLNIDEFAKNIVGKSTFTNWPFLFEGLVVGVSDAHNEIHAALQPAPQQSQQGNSVRLEKQASSDLPGRAKRIQAKYATRYGVEIGKVNALLHVRPLQGLQRLSNAAVVKEFAHASDQIEYPWQLVVHHVVQQDPRFQEQPGLAIHEEFPDQTRVFYLGDKGYGCPARVLGTDSNGVAIELALAVDLPQELRLMHKLVQERGADHYVVANHVAHRLRISSLVLSRITSSMLVMIQNKKRNLGLNLKFEAKGRKVLGYTQRTSMGWEYSEKAISLIKQFVDAFPDLIQSLARRPPQGGIYHDSDLFPQNTQERIRDLIAFEKQHKVRELEDVPIYVDRLERKVVATLENAVRILAKKRAESKTFNIKRQILRGVPRHALLKPSEARMQVFPQRFALGDRVVNVLDFGTVPLGAKGTVVGLGTQSIDIVLDAPFLGGTNLQGVCSEYRGATVGLADVLNLTTPQLAAKWGGDLTDSANVSALMRTLQQTQPSTHNRSESTQPQAKSFMPKNAFKEAPPTKSFTAKLGKGVLPRPDSLQKQSQPSSPSANGKVDAAAKHLEMLSLNKSARPPRKQAWRSQPASKPKGNAE